MSIAQDEIEEQIKAIKEEWKTVVQSLSSNTEAPPGLSRADFKEWKAQHQQNAKERLAELEERLKRLQLLQTRCLFSLLLCTPESHAKAKCLADSEKVVILDRMSTRDGLKAVRSKSVKISFDTRESELKVAPAFDSQRIGTAWEGDLFHGSDSLADNLQSEYDMLALPGVVDDRLRLPQTAPAIRRLNDLVPGFDNSSAFRAEEHKRAATGHPSYDSSHVIRQMVKGSLQMHMSSETTSDEMPSKKIRALAALPSPSTVKEKSRGEATLSIVETSKVSMSSSDIPEPDKVGVQEISSKATDQGPDVVGTTTSDREEIPSKGMPHKSMQQQTWVHRAPRTPKEPEVERQEVPGTLQKCTPVSCPWFFGGFKRTNPFRRLCFELKSNPFFNAFAMAITVGNSIYIAMAPDIRDADGGESEKAYAENLLKALEYFDIGCAIFLGFEVLIGIIAYGFCRTPSTFLRNSGFHQLDFVCIWVTVMEYVASSLGLPNVTLRPFRMLRFFKLICKIQMFGGVTNIIRTLVEGLPQLIIIFGFLLLTLAAWAILCMSMYSTSMRRRCVSRSGDIPLCASDFSTGFSQTCNMSTDVRKTVKSEAGSPAIAAGYPFETWCKIVGVEWDEDENEDWIQPTPFNGTYDSYLVRRGYYDKGQSYGLTYPKDNLGRYHTCQASAWRAIQNYTTTQRCEEVGNPMDGFSHFDNVWGSFVSLAQVVVPDSYYDVWGRLQESEPWILPATILLFIVINVIDTFLLLGLFVAVVTGTFQRIRNQHERANFLTDSQLQDVFDAAIENEERAAKEAQEIDDDDNDNEDENKSGEEIMRRSARKMIKSPYFTTFISLVIGLQLFSIAIASEDLSLFWQEFSYYAGIGCSVIFLLELALNFMALMDWTRFWGETSHRVEATLVFLSFVGIIGGIPELAVLPALRGFRLMKYTRTLQELLSSAASSIVALVNVIVFIALVGLCYVVAGRYMFGKRMDHITRSNFGTFTQSILTMFQLLTGDSWSGVMYASMWCFEDSASQMFGALLVISWMIFANLIALNLFVAVIIENFQISDTISSIKAPGNVASVRTYFRDMISSVHRRNKLITHGHVKLDVNTGQLSGSNMKSSARVLYEEFAEVEEEIRKRLLQADTDTSAPKSRILLAVTAATSTGTSAIKDAGIEDAFDDPERVLGFLMPNNPIRIFFVSLGQSQTFDNVILVAILVSCFFLIIEPPYRDMIEYPEQVEPNDPPMVSFATLDLCNGIFTLVFLVEFVCRIMGQGLYFTKSAYLKDGWNIIDTLVLVVALIEYSKVLEGFGVVKIIRMGRALKPLRLMKRNKSMRIVIDALLTTIAPLAYVIMFLLFTLVVFGLIAIGAFGRKLFNCSNPNVAFPEGKIECTGPWIVQDGNLNGVMFPSVWDNPSVFNFDSFSRSFISLFMVSTFKYVAIIFACMDVTKIDQAPVENNSVYWSIFFVVYISVGGLFVMNLFVAFIIDGFNAAKGSTQQEEVYRRFCRQLHNSRPQYDAFKPPTNQFSTKLRKFIESHAFQAFSTTCVLINVFMMLADNADATGNHAKLIQLQGDIFYYVLCGEVLLCSIAYGLLGFYNDLWKLLDLVVCLGTLAGYLSNNKSISDFVKVFRLGRVLRLAIKIKAIRAILMTVVQVAPQLSNVVLLLFLVYSMFASAGTQLFSTTRFGARLGPTAAFSSYIRSLVLVYQIITGDEWNILMVDCSVQPPACTEKFTKEFEPTYQGPDRSWGDCGVGPMFAGGYYVVLKLICEYMMLNLFIGLILDNFSYITEDVGHEEDPEWSDGPSENQLEDICNVFKRYDLGTGFVPVSSLSALLDDLGLPLGYRESDGRLYKKDEHARELLIRAELNLCMRQYRAQQREKEKKQWFKRPDVKQVYINGVSYETCISTIVFWRMSSGATALVPPVVQWERRERMEESVLMAHALQVLEFFRQLVARRKRIKINEMMAKRRSFMQFCETDPHRRRRNIITTEAKKGWAEAAKVHNMPIIQVLNKPNELVNDVVMNWHPVKDLPEDFVTHSKACVDFQVMRVPQPITGIEVFKQRVSTHEVVLKVVDPISHNVHGDLLLADFSKVEWREWHCLNTKVETYFQPNYFSGFDDLDRLMTNAEWDRVDLLVRTVPKKGGPARTKRFGSLEDIQSFVVEEAQQESTVVPQKKRYERAKSTLRINLGNHLHTSDKIKLQAISFEARKFRLAKPRMKFTGLGQVREQNEASLLSEVNRHVDLSEGDTILEVFGYIPK